jgi:feruloyl esterase
LRAFKSRGGKLVMFTGWADQFIAPQQTIDYYKRIDAATDASSFARLFVAPGMAHCSGGNGPSSFGQDVGVAPFPTDPSRDLLTALTNWVEGGQAPEQVVATKFDNDNATTGDVTLTRPICAYPKVAQYKGSGDTNKAENFSCGLPG